MNIHKDLTLGEAQGHSVYMNAVQYSLVVYTEQGTRGLNS